MIDQKLAEYAPEFESIDASGRKIKLSGYKNRLSIVLVLNRGFG
jgi:hypothetical protein